jgi:hypothetical protein
VERSARLFHECALLQAPQPNVLYPMTNKKIGRVKMFIRPFSPGLMIELHTD